MPLQESHPRGKVAAVAAPQADLAGDRNKSPLSGDLGTGNAPGTECLGFGSWGSGESPQPPLVLAASVTEPPKCEIGIWGR